MEYTRRDWVASEIECDATRIFDALCAILQDDAAAACAHLGRGSAGVDDGHFHAKCSHNWGDVRRGCVVFETGAVIHVNDENGSEIAVAQPTLDDDDVAGEPKLMVAGVLAPGGPKTMAVWEFSRLVLKDVFFPPTQQPKDTDTPG